MINYICGIYEYALRCQYIQKGASSKLPDAPFGSCFYILNSNLNPTPEDYRAAFLIDADVIDQTAPQFFPELRLFSGQIFQLGDEVREYLFRVILFLDKCLQFQKAAMLFSIQGAELLFFLRFLRSASPQYFSLVRIDFHF